MQGFCVVDWCCREAEEAEKSQNLWVDFIYSNENSVLKFEIELRSFEYDDGPKIIKSMKINFCPFCQTQILDMLKVQFKTE